MKVFKIEKLIDIKDLIFSYDNKQDILQKVSFEITQGDFLAIIGPNGGGKSTLLKVILKLLSPKSGKISIKDPKKIGYVPQDINHNKDFPITVLDVVLTGLEGNRKRFFYYSKEEKRKAEEKLFLTGIEDLKSKKIGALSGGQRQRVMIARSLISEPELLLLDEPTSNIDPKGQKEIFELLKDLNKTLTIGVVSHDISLLLGYATRVAYVNRNITMHTVEGSKDLLTGDEHFCEVELINEILGKKSRGCAC